ncbi:tyrosine-protein phosphatase [Stackebrandtia soli]|uniref:tyrosine-protein phosphatase n=1 Tax=Stackebrandtia soli TaxID=1892856 RepID=UPI0039E96C8C
MAYTRHIPLEGGLNLRDIGGYRTEKGRALVKGRLFRSGSLTKLTDDDVKVIDRLGLHTVIDFRVSAEIVGDGPDRLPDGITVTNLPVGGGTFQQLQAAATADDPQEIGKALAAGRGEQTMLDITRGFVSDEVQREQFATALRAITDQRRVPLLYHCTAGKDRTGWMTAIVLRLLDVPMETIVEDYVLSNEYFAKATEGLLAAAEFAGLDGRLIRPLLEQRPEYLKAAFDEADSIFGSFTGFVQDGLNIEDDLVSRLRQSMLD